MQLEVCHDYCFNIMSSISAQRLSLPFQKMTEKWKNGEVFTDYHTKSIPASDVDYFYNTAPWHDFLVFQGHQINGSGPNSAACLLCDFGVALTSLFQLPFWTM